MSTSASRPKGTTDASPRKKPVSLWWAVPCGLALGILTLALKPEPSSASLDLTTVVPPSQLLEMFREYQRIEFSQLAGFPYGESPRDHVPSDVRALDGRRIGVGGFMLPVDYDGAGVTEFLLNANYDMCYFGAPTLPNQFIVVKMRDGRRTRFVHTPIVAFGTLSVREERRGERVVSLYRMDADAIGLGAVSR